MVRLTGVARAEGAAAALGTDDRIRHEVAGTRVVPVTLLVLLVVLLLAAGRTRGRPRRVVAALLLPVSLGWVVFNGRLEGPVLITLSQSHGVTASDLLAVLGVVVALVVLVLERRPRKRSGPPPAAPRVEVRDH